GAHLHDAAGGAERTEDVGSGNAAHPLHQADDANGLAVDLRRRRLPVGQQLRGVLDVQPLELGLVHDDRSLLRQLVTEFRRDGSNRADRIVHQPATDQDAQVRPALWLLPEAEALNVRLGVRDAWNGQNARAQLRLGDRLASVHTQHLLWTNPDVGVGAVD